VEQTQEGCLVGLTGEAQLKASQGSDHVGHMGRLKWEVWGMDIPGSSRTQKHLISHLMGLPMVRLARHALRPQPGRTSLI
jgi:hypothetical protein